MKYRHQFRLPASIEQVAELRFSSASMLAITPPPLSVGLRHAPEVLGEEGDTDFNLGVGRVSIRWLARSVSSPNRCPRDV